MIVGAWLKEALPLHRDVLTGHGEDCPIRDRLPAEEA
jgi:hypothetical protein